MDKLGVIAILSGILLVVAYVAYELIVSITAPFIIKVAISLILVGLIFVIIKQVQDRMIEKNEHDQFKDL